MRPLTLTDGERQGTLDFVRDFCPRLTQSMSKRSLSPSSYVPAAKRAHVVGQASRRPVGLLGFENTLYDELILCIFSHLSWMDLCTTQSTSKTWARLAGDNELWRKQYLQVYGRTRLRGAKGFIARVDGREVRPLPGRVKADIQQKDWKWMFRISSNWKKGRCLVEDDIDLSHQPKSIPESLRHPKDHITHIILAGSLIISATSYPSLRPTMSIVDERHEHHAIPIFFNEDGSRHSRITSLALDQSPPVSGNLSVACFLQTGAFVVFDFKHSSPASTVQKYAYQPTRGSDRLQTIIHAVYYYPLIATLTNNFSISIYDLSSGSVRLTQTLSSFTSYPPASLVLSCLSPSAFKLVIAYSVPVYPMHWSTGATELIISRSFDPSVAIPSGSALFASTSFREDFKHPIPSKINVLSSRTIRAFDVPTGWVDENSLQAMRAQWGRKMLNIADIQTDGKWVVVAPGQRHSSDEVGLHISSNVSDYSSLDNSASVRLNSPTSLQLYRLLLPNHSSSISASPPKLTFVRTLHGQTGPISSLALADGRCVSLSHNGSIWVWDLEGGTGAEVAPADATTKDQYDYTSTVDSVIFDERRIVSTHGGKVVVRRFDI